MLDRNCAKTSLETVKSPGWLSQTRDSLIHLLVVACSLMGQTAMAVTPAITHFSSSTMASYRGHNGQLLEFSAAPPAELVTGGDYVLPAQRFPGGESQRNITKPAAPSCAPSGFTVSLNPLEEPAPAVDVQGNCSRSFSYSGQ